MFLPRIIPVLLLKGKGLVKTINFKEPRYIGDPINAVKIFNDLKADELVFLDIAASKEGRTIAIDLVKNIGDEAFMPFAVGGGIKSVKQIGALISAGAEKVVINTESINNQALIPEAANHFGSQSIIVSIDVKKNIFGDYKIYTGSGKIKNHVDLIDHIHNIERLGAGEILINSIDNDGLMSGYDLKLIKVVTESVTIPVIACGGAGCLDHLKQTFDYTNVSALAAGSMFVYHGSRKAVLINYPSKIELLRLFKDSNE